MKSHGAVASLVLGEELVRAVWADVDSAPLDNKLRAALRLCKRVTSDPKTLCRDDFSELRALGIEEQSIEDVIHITCAFNIITRIADALEFDVPDWEKMKRGAKILLKRGYIA